ncbi:unnamed protein product, partial [Heterosigma akashiwo]
LAAAGSPDPSGWRAARRGRLPAVAPAGAGHVGRRPARGVRGPAGGRAGGAG